MFIPQKTTTGLIRVFIFFATVGVPITLLYYFFFSKNPLTKHGVFLIAFLLLHAFERVWETFFTTQEKRVMEFHGDWTLAVVTIAYLVLYWFIMVEYFYFGHSLQNWTYSGTGLFFYLLAMGIRFWGMKTLAHQWAIHAVGARKINKVFLVTAGPYKHIRHPIYLAIMIELLSLPLIANTAWSMFFVVLVNIPLQYMRLLVEEKSNIRKLGNEYLAYKSKVDALIPLRIFSHKN